MDYEDDERKPKTPWAYALPFLMKLKHRQCEYWDIPKTRRSMVKMTAKRHGLFISIRKHEGCYRVRMLSALEAFDRLSKRKALTQSV